MKKWYKYIIYASVLFAIIYLAKANFLIVPEIYSFQSLTWCILTLFAGFIFDGLAWGAALNKQGYRKVSFLNAIVGHGISIFGKYIPGKLWVIIGRAGYISKKYDLDEKEIGILSLNTQFISLWVGLLLSSLMFFELQISKYKFIILITFFIWFLLTLILFTNFFHRLFKNIYKRLFKKDVLISKLDFSVALSIIPYYLIMWLLWCSSFYFLMNTVTNYNLPVLSALSFPFAANIGLIIIIAPGGLGVRESLLLGVLLIYDISMTDATTISVISRLWFFIGEIFIFLLSIVLSFFRK